MNVTIQAKIPLPTLPQMPQQMQQMQQQLGALANPVNTLLQGGLGALASPLGALGGGNPLEMAKGLMQGAQNLMQTAGQIMNMIPGMQGPGQMADTLGSMAGNVAGGIQQAQNFGQQMSQLNNHMMGQMNNMCLRDASNQKQGGQHSIMPDGTEVKPAPPTKEGKGCNDNPPPTHLEKKPGEQFFHRVDDFGREVNEKGFVSVADEQKRRTERHTKEEAVIDQLTKFKG